MNVNDVTFTGLEELLKKPLSSVFSCQKELAEKYVVIERLSGIGHGLLPSRFDIDHPRCQYVLKDFAWRVTEEVGEALTAKAHGSNPNHILEEIADGLHFITELCLLVDISADDILWSSDNQAVSMAELLSSGSGNPKEDVADFIANLGFTMCRLKQRPWKQTFFETDIPAFRQGLINSYRSYLIMAGGFGMTVESLICLYFKKNLVNDFRIRSQY